jgi:hypothetical protein
MKNIFKKSKSVTKGAPSGLVISLLVHAAAFMLAGLLVVFSVVKKKEISFVPPPAVERPKMKLKKPKVKVKKSAKPASPTRIMAKVSKAVMPDLTLPELGGAGTGFGGIGDLGGFDVMPDLSELSALGSTTSIGNDLVGTCWDLKFTRSGTYSPMGDEEWREMFHKFFRKWDTSIFSGYYRLPQKLYTTSLLMPPTISALAPVAFGMDDNMASGGHWIVYYKGKLAHKEGITFRFWVGVDDSIAIRINKEVVVAGSMTGSDGTDERASKMFRSKWKTDSHDSLKYWFGYSLAIVGDWVTLEPGVAYDMEVVITDNAAAGSFFMVAVEEEGKEYPRNRQGGPILPIFKMSELSRDHLDIIYKSLPEGEVDCINGPIFRDF